MSLVAHGRVPAATAAVRSNRTDVRNPLCWATIFRRIWPHGTAAELAARAGVSIRAAEYWLARRSNLSADALAALLRSDAGLDVLSAAIGEARPAWWRSFKRTMQIAELRRRQEQQRRLLERLEEEAAG